MDGIPLITLLLSEQRLSGNIRGLKFRKIVHSSGGDWECNGVDGVSFHPALYSSSSTVPNGHYYPSISRVDNMNNIFVREVVALCQLGLIDPVRAQSLALHQQLRIHRPVGSPSIPPPKRILLAALTIQFTTKHGASSSVIASPIRENSALFSRTIKPPPHTVISRISYHFQTMLSTQERIAFSSLAI